MRKISAIMLLLAMLCGCAALAETAEKEYIATVDANGVFELRCALPEGYQITEGVSEDPSYRTFRIEGEKDKPYMTLSIAFDEMYADTERLNDLDSEEKNALLATFSAEDIVESSITKTDFGTELITVRETDGETDYVVFFTIYKGYEIEFVLNAPVPENDGDAAAGLTDAQIQMAVRFLSDLDFIPETP